MEFIKVSLATNEQWRASTRAESSKRGILVAKNNASPVGNAGTNYLESKAGMIMARDSGGKHHSCGLASVAAIAAANVAVLGNAAGFNVGDLVSIVSSANRAKAITNNSVVLTITAKVAGLSLVITVSGANTAFSSSYNPATKTITIVSATDGSSVATTTHATLVSELVSKYGAFIESATSATPATVVAALASTGLGAVKYETLASARTVSAKSGLELTLSGAAITCADDDIIVKDGAYKPAGILDSNAVLWVGSGGTPTPVEADASLAVEGDVRDSSTLIFNLPAANTAAGALMRKALGGHVYNDPVGGAEVVPGGLVGFRFLS